MLLRPYKTPNGLVTMSNSRTVKRRTPAVAGRFYSDDARQCARDAAELCRDAGEASALPQTLYGAMVPHAGWICSGRTAGRTLRVLSQHTQAKTVVLTGSVHTMQLFAPALDAADAWTTPMGDVEVDHALHEAMVELDDFETIDAAHVREHSLEVQLPLLIETFGDDVKIVPVMIPPADQATTWGQSIGRLLADWPAPVVMVASSDLTHYGPNYGFTPQGDGAAGVRWAYEVNDRSLLDRIESMDTQAIVPETRHRKNACGGGAIAATMACCQTLGARRGIVIEHTHAGRELAALGHRDDRNTVGYAGVVFG